MPTATEKLVIHKGATFIEDFYWQDADGKPVSLAGFDGKLQVRQDRESDDVLLELSIDNGGIFFEKDGQGHIQFYHGATKTKKIKWSKGVYDFLIKNKTDLDDVVRLIEGPIEISFGVTQ